jgi:hypothetical protein
MPSSLASIESLSLEACHLTDADLNYMPAVWPSLRKLNLAGNVLTSKGACTLADTIDMPVLRVLNVAWNPIGDTGGVALVKRFCLKGENHLQQQQHLLETLDLSATAVVRCKVPTISAPVQRSRRWGMRQGRRSTNNRDGLNENRNGMLSSNISGRTSPNQLTRYLGLGTCRVLAQATPIHLRRLHLDRQTCLESEGVALLARNLPNYLNLEELSLQGSLVDDDGVTALATVLPFVSQIRILNLSMNQITNKGACVLARTLSCNVNPSLQDVRLVQNRMGLKGLQAMEEAVQVNLHLQRLTVSGHEAGRLGKVLVDNLQGILRRNRRLQRILHENNDKAAGLSVLVPELLIYATRQGNKGVSTDVSRLFAVLRFIPSIVEGRLE